MPKTDYTGYYSRIKAVCHSFDDLRMYLAHCNQLAPHGHPAVHSIEELLVDLGALHGRASAIAERARELAIEKGDDTPTARPSA